MKSKNASATLFVCYLVISACSMRHLPDDCTLTSCTDAVKLGKLISYILADPKTVRSQYTKVVGVPEALPIKVLDQPSNRTRFLERTASSNRNSTFQTALLTYDDRQISVGGYWLIIRDPNKGICIPAQEVTANVSRDYTSFSMSGVTSFVAGGRGPNSRKVMISFDNTLNCLTSIVVIKDYVQQ